MSGRFVLAQISDMHVRAARRDDGFDPLARLNAALAAIETFGASAIIATGDLVNDERPEEYALLAQALKRASAPVFLVPGNHDSRELIRAHFPDHAYLPNEGDLSFAIDDFPLRLVGIDQICPGETGGLFTTAHAEWLDDTLSRRPDLPTLVALHHPPISTYDQLLDRIGLAHAERLTAVLRKHPQVKRVVCGHHHRAVFGQIAHAPLFVCPSTAWTFGLALSPDDPLAERSGETDGWALHVWDEASGLATHVMGL
ncbi:MAG: metallophosphoesterase [Hyphomonadaceae bacterium]|nr:metallophosphoesterase [Hyphomonadaceae bacterium]